MSDWSKKFAKKVSDLGKKILHPGGDESRTADAAADTDPPEPVEEPAASPPVMPAKPNTSPPPNEDERIPSTDH